MARKATLILAAGGLGVAAMLIASPHPLALALVQPGLWEIRGAPGTHSPIRQCIADIAALGTFEHRTKSCNARVLKDSVSSTRIDYSCGRAGFGLSQIDVLTPRSLRISTQGISGGLPFNYVLQARRIDSCPKSAFSTSH